MKEINIKKGAIALAFITTIAFTTPACASINDITYESNASGYKVGIEGTVSHKLLERAKFVKVYNNLTEETSYTIGVLEPLAGHRYDLFNRRSFANTGGGMWRYENLDDAEEWLISLDMLKDEYTEEELINLLNIFIEYQEKDKQLVKE